VVIGRTCGRLAASVAAILALSAPVRAAQPWATQKEADRLMREIEAFFAGAEVRYPGSPGNLAVEEKVAGILKLRA